MSSESYFCPKCREFTFVRYREGEMTVLKCEACDKPMLKDYDQKEFQKWVDEMIKSVYINKYKKVINEKSISEN